jgi:hypothetical protein
MMHAPHSILSAGALALLSLIGASRAQTPAEPGTESADSVAVGRLDAMLDQSEELLEGLAPTDQDMSDVDDFHQLQIAVLRYRLILIHACDMSVAEPQFCAAPYAPSWLNDPPGREPGAAELAARIEDAKAHIRPFWIAVCERAMPDEKSACEME